MALFVVSPAALKRLAEGSDKSIVPDLTVTDDRDNYSTSDGDGLWIAPFMEFIEEIVAQQCRQASFHFSRDDTVSQEIINEIQSGYVRGQIIKFTNAHYEDWRDHDVSLPDYDDVRSDARSYCDECTSGWDEIHGEYDGPSADDVEADESLDPDLPDEERQARLRRNRERLRERDRRQRAQEAAEEEVIDREFTCDDDCEGFLDHVDDCYRDRFEANLGALRERWRQFIRTANPQQFPPLNR